MFMAVISTSKLVESASFSEAVNLSLNLDFKCP